MKLSEVKPCTKCGGPLGSSFNVIRSSIAFVSPKAAQATLGLFQILGGHGLGIAEALSPDAEVIKIAGEENPQLWTQALLCQECWLHCFGEVFEKASYAKEATP